MDFVWTNKKEVPEAYNFFGTMNADKSLNASLKVSKLWCGGISKAAALSKSEALSNGKKKNKYRGKHKRPERRFTHSAEITLIIQHW